MTRLWRVVITVLAVLSAPGIGVSYTEPVFAQGKLGPARSAQEAAQRFIELNAKAQLMTPVGQLVNRVAAVPTLGELSGPDRIERPLDDYAVARVLARGPNGQPTNGYLLLYKDSWGSWSVHEARGLYRAFEAKVDAPNMRFSEKRLEEQYLHQAEIAAKTDQELSRWFEGMRPEFDKLRVMIKTGPHGAYAYGPAKRPRADDFTLVLYNLGANVRSIVVSREDLLVRVFQDGEEMVGFHYSPVSPPRFGPDSNIWMESLGDDWYLVRKIPKCPWPAERFNCRGRR